MSFLNKFPEWKNEGTPPPEELQTNGFEGGDKPPAAWMNWLCSLVAKCVTELQSEVTSHEENKENPHEVTKAQVGLGNADNTADSEKAVRFAQEAGVGRKVQNALSIRFKGGSTEGTDLFTFDGSTSRSVNITPEKIEGARVDLENVDSDVLKNKIIESGAQGVVIVNATSTDGVAYTATVDNFEFKVGAVIAFIPDITSTSKMVTLDINGTGAVRIYQSISSVSSAMVSPTSTNWLNKGRPVLLTYYQETNETSGYVTKVWKTVATRTTDEDLYGTLGVAGGGTGATNAEDARENLGIPEYVEYMISKYPSYHDVYYGTGNYDEYVINLPVLPKFLIAYTHEDLNRSTVSQACLIWIPTTGLAVQFAASPATGTGRSNFVNVFYKPLNDGSYDVGFGDDNYHTFMNEANIGYSYFVVL